MATSMIKVIPKISDNNYWSLFSYDIRSKPTDKLKCQIVTTTESRPYELWGHSESQISVILRSILDWIKTDLSGSQPNLNKKLEAPGILITSSSDRDLGDGSKSPPPRRLNLSSIRFPHACVCGHNIEIRDLIYDPRNRKNTRCPGITIRPKTQPITVNLRT